MHPISLFFVSSYLLRNGYLPLIIDLSTSFEPRSELRTFLRENSYDVVGFTSSTESRFLVWDLIRDTRELSPESKIVAGGDHFSFTAEQAMEAIPKLNAGKMPDYGYLLLRVRGPQAGHGIAVLRIVEAYVLDFSADRFRHLSLVPHREKFLK